MKKTLVAAAVLLAFSAAPGHAIDLNPLSMMKGVVEAAVEDRSAGDIAADAEIKAKIAANIVDQMGSDVISIGVDVYEQDVMLTGVVDTSKQKQQAGKIAYAVSGVKKVYNDVQVKTDLEKEKGAVEGFVDDTVIETKINALLLDASGVNVTNFRYRSVGGEVYLFGRALSAGELKKAVSIVAEIENVRSVTHHVKIKPKS